MDTYNNHTWERHSWVHWKWYYKIAGNFPHICHIAGDFNESFAFSKKRSTSFEVHWIRLANYHQFEFCDNSLHIVRKPEYWTSKSRLNFYPSIMVVQISKNSHHLYINRSLKFFKQIYTISITSRFAKTLKSSPVFERNIWTVP